MAHHSTTDKAGVEELIQRALVLWYNGKSGKTGKQVKRRVQLSGLRQTPAAREANPKFVWGVSFDDTQSTVSIEERQARRNLRVESRLLLRQKEALARQQQLMTTSLRGARMATANGGDGPAGGPEIQTRGG